MPEQYEKGHKQTRDVLMVDVMPVKSTPELMVSGLKVKVPAPERSAGGQRTTSHCHAGTRRATNTPAANEPVVAVKPESSLQ